MIPGDQASAQVLVSVDQSTAFRVFTEEIDRWWRHGLRYRVAGHDRGVICLEPGVGGRLLESFEREGQTHIIQTGEVTAWEPPTRLLLTWRAVNFTPDQSTEVEVLFRPSPSGTLVTVIHRGWSKIPLDHAVRHSQDVPAFLRRNGLWWGDLLSSLRERCYPA